MRFFRYFHGHEATEFNRWTKDPPSHEVVKRFLDDRSNRDENAPPEGISVSRAENYREEIENAAAWLISLKRTKPERVFAVALEQEDIVDCGIRCAHTPTNGPGIEPVDSRHHELSGTVEQFTDLLKRTVRRLVATGTVVRVYTPCQIRLQIEAFTTPNGSAFTNRDTERHARELLCGAKATDVRKRFAVRNLCIGFDAPHCFCQRPV